MAFLQAWQKSFILRAELLMQIYDSWSPFFFLIMIMHYYHKNNLLERLAPSSL